MASVAMMRSPSLQLTNRFEAKKAPTERPHRLQRSANVRSRAVFPVPTPPWTHIMVAESILLLSQSSSSLPSSIRVSSMHLGWSTLALESGRAAGDACSRRWSTPDLAFSSSDKVDDIYNVAHLSGRSYRCSVCQLFRRTQRSVVS